MTWRDASPRERESTVDETYTPCAIFVPYLLNVFRATRHFARVCDLRKLAAL